MPETKPAYQRLEELQLTPSYDSRASAIAAGQEVGEYGENDPIKGWKMTKEDALAVPGRQTQTYRGEVLITFPSAFFGKQAVCPLTLDQQTGKVQCAPEPAPVKPEAKP